MCVSILCTLLLATSLPASCMKTAAEWKAIMARFVYATSPDYSRSLRAKHMEGTGCFRMHVDEQGRVTSVIVLVSTGHRELDDRAVAAFLRWRAKPMPGRPWNVDMSLSFVADQ